MAAYYFLISLPLLVSLFTNKKNKRLPSKNYSIITFFLIFIFLLCVRDVTCGTDLLNYYDLYTYFDYYRFDTFSIKSLFNFSITEPGFVLLEKIIYKISNGSFRLFIVICSIVSLIPVFVLYFKESKHDILTLILFLSVAPFSMFFSGLRQSIAIGIGVLCYYCVKNKKIILFLLSVFVGFLFHQSSVILILMYPLYNLRINKNKIWFVIPFIFICIVFNRQILSVLINILGRYGNRYSLDSSTGAYGFLILLIMFLAFSFIIPDEKSLSRDTIGLRNFLVIMVLIQCFAPIHTIAMRFNYYYLIFIPIIIPKIIDSKSKQMSSIANCSIYIMCVSFLLYFFYNAYFGADILHIFPYVSIWNN